MSKSMEKIKCKMCKKIIREGEGFTCSMARNEDRFCDEFCVSKWVDRKIKLEERAENY
jgi:hypothetical protein